jgi:diguanylate cyclase (GGDEF)-like protein
VTASEPSPDGSGHSEGSRILVVEDDPEIRHLLSVVLDAEDREVVTVEDGAGARRIMRDERVDMVLLDLVLPDLDGRTLLTDLRENRTTATVPVVVITARSDQDLREDCYALGADVYIEKPFDPAELEHEVDARLRRSADRDRDELVDPLTGLLNRAGLVQECEDASGAFGIALIQIDGFAALTEAWGWEGAEEVIRRVGRAVAESAGEGAFVGRLGGAEFAVYVPDPRAVEPVAMAERILDAVRVTEVRAPDGELVNPTASIGVVDVASGGSLREAVLDARRRLFRAREEGNQVVAADDADGDSGARVLVAEDDEISATLLLHRLKKEGLDVVRFDNGRDAYEAALEDVPDLVILDIKMPGMDGFEVLERLRRSPASS